MITIRHLIWRASKLSPLASGNTHFIIIYITFFSILLKLPISYKIIDSICIIIINKDVKFDIFFKKKQFPPQIIVLIEFLFFIENI